MHAETVARRSSRKQVFLKILQNDIQNIVIQVRSRSTNQVFLKVLTKTLKITFLTKHLRPTPPTPKISTHATHAKILWNYATHIIMFNSRQKFMDPTPKVDPRQNFMDQHYAHHPRYLADLGKRSDDLQCHGNTLLTEIRSFYYYPFFQKFCTHLYSEPGTPLWIVLGVVVVPFRFIPLQLITDPLTNLKSNKSTMKELCCMLEHVQRKSNEAIFTKCCEPRCDHCSNHSVINQIAWEHLRERDFKWPNPNPIYRSSKSLYDLYRDKLFTIMDIIF